MCFPSCWTQVQPNDLLWAINCEQKRHASLWNRDMKNQHLFCHVFYFFNRRPAASLSCSEHGYLSRAELQRTQDQHVTWTGYKLLLAWDSLFLQHYLAYPHCACFCPHNNNIINIYVVCITFCLDFFYICLPFPKGHIYTTSCHFFITEFQLHSSCSVLNSKCPTNSLICLSQWCSASVLWHTGVPQGLLKCPVPVFSQGHWSFFP